MGKIYDEQTDFTTDTDDNQNQSSAIQPVVGDEKLWENVLNRSPENLRKRTEVLRQAVDDLRYYADYDRGLLLTASTGQTFQVASPISGAYTLQMTDLLGSLWIYPAATPGRHSGGRNLGAVMFTAHGSAWLPYAGTATVNDLTFVATSASTGMRGFADTDSLATGGFSVGANRLHITLSPDPTIAGGIGSISSSVVGTPVTKITIKYGSGTLTSIKNIIDYVAANTTLSRMVRGRSTLSDTAAALAAPPAITNAVFQGGYDAEAHQVRASDLATFFLSSDNYLQEGESLALAFAPGPVERVTGNHGGRRQSLFDAPTSQTGGSTSYVNSPNLFNTGRSPELIPGSIPIGKVVDGLFVFIDGTTVGTSPVALGETPGTIARSGASTTALNNFISALAHQPATDGASLVGFTGGGNWHADSNGSSSGNTITQATLHAAILQVLSQLAAYADSDSGARRIGAEAIDANPSDGNEGLALASGSVRQQLTQLLKTQGSSITPGGVNSRVSEYGHRLHGKGPMEKVFSETGPEDLSGGGAQILRVVLNAPASGSNVLGQIEDPAVVYLQPYWYPVASSDDNLDVVELIEAVDSTHVRLTAMSAGRGAVLLENVLFSDVIYDYFCIVSLQGVTAGSGGSGSGYYFASTFTPSNGRLRLRNLNGSNPNFTGAVFNSGGSSTVTFYRTSIVGNSIGGVRVRSMIPQNLVSADSVYYGSGMIKQAYADQSGNPTHTETPLRSIWNGGALNTIASGTGASTSAPDGSGYVTVGYMTGAGITSGSVGLYLTLSDAGSNTGTFPIVEVVSATSAKIHNPSGGVPLVNVNWVFQRDAARDTNNILFRDDANLLRGIENAHPLDASENHHHDSRYLTIPDAAATYLPIPSAKYTRTVVHAAPVACTLSDSAWGSDLGSLGGVSSTMLYTPTTGAPGTGWKKVASVLRFALQAYYNPRIRPEVDVNFTVRMALPEDATVIDTLSYVAPKGVNSRPSAQPVGQFLMCEGSLVSDGDYLSVHDGTRLMHFIFTTGASHFGGVNIQYYSGDSADLMANRVEYWLRHTNETHQLDIDVVRLASSLSLFNTNPNAGAAGNVSIVPAGDYVSHVTASGFSGGEDGQDPRYYEYQTLVPVAGVPRTAFDGLALTANPASHHLASSPGSTLHVFEVAAVFEQT
jgi:hypothetical protein